MNREYISFIKPLSWHTMDSIFRNLGLEYTPPNNLLDSAQYLGFSDSRLTVPNTICFIDKEPSIDVINNLSDVMVITNHLLTPYFKKSAVVQTKDPRAFFIKLLDLFEKEKKCLPFTSQILNQIPTIHQKATIDPRAIIEEGVSIGKGSIISAGVVVKKGTVIGENCIIRENCTIGCNGISLYKTIYEETLRFPHLAGVNIANNVELGASVIIVRGTLTNTRIEEDTVIGNLCNIGHGVKISKKVWISVGTLIGGNCSIGKYTTIGLGSRLKDNLTIGENISIGMGSVVTKHLPSFSSVFGNPAKKLRSLNTGPKR